MGVWLETDWYRKQAVIKEIKKDSYAFKHTDVQVNWVMIRFWSCCLQLAHFRAVSSKPRLPDCYFVPPWTRPSVLPPNRWAMR